MFTGRTAAEAEEKYERLHGMIDAKSALALLKERLGGIDLSGQPLDGPVPEMKGNPALCLIDLSAGPDPDVLYGLVRRRRCPG